MKREMIVLKYLKKLHAIVFFQLLSVSLMYSSCSTDDGIEKIGIVAQIDDLGLPVVVVETIDRVEPDCDYVYDENGRNLTIINETKVPGRMLIIESGDTLYDSGSYEKKKGGMTLKIRGNTSAFSPKKPYKIKLQKEADLIQYGGGCPRTLT